MNPQRLPESPGKVKLTMLQAPRLLLLRLPEEKDAGDSAKQPDVAGLSCKEFGILGRKIATGSSPGQDGHGTFQKNLDSSICGLPGAQ